MKRFYVMMILMVFCTVAARSQAFEGGVLVGLNASQVDGDGYSGYKKPGIVAGGYVLTHFSERVFGGMEIKFAQKGSRKNPDFKKLDYEKYLMRLNYIDLPVYLGVHTSEKTSILAGLSAGYLMSGTEISDLGKLPPEDEHPFNEFDIQGFIGFRFHMTDRWAVDLRGAYSLLPIREKPGDALNYWLDSQFSNLLSTTILYRLDF